MANERYIKNLIPTPKDNRSAIERLGDLPKEKQIEILDDIARKRFDGDISKLKYAWELHRRPSQWYPDHDDWKIFFYLAGRGSGKTRTAAEIVRHRVDTGLSKNITLIGPTSNDITGTMLHGPSGLLTIYPEHQRPIHSPTYKTVTWSNGAVARYFSADEPERIRGVNSDLLWFDEIAAARYAKESWDESIMGLRLGNPKAIVTSTPKPLKILLEILQRKDCYTYVGSSHENASNIDLSMFLEEYEGTRRGRQEIYAELLFENDDALFKLSMIENYRINKKDTSSLPQMLYMFLAIDPAVSMNSASAETGITVVGYGTDGHFYVVYSDSEKSSPNEWAVKALRLYDHYRCDRIVAEANNGGDLVISNIANIRPNAPVYKVHATRGKIIRAEPIATLYERGKVHHVGTFGKLESQMLDFPPTNKDTLLDCLDSLVWGITALLEMTARGSSYMPLVGGSRSKMADYITNFS